VTGVEAFTEKHSAAISALVSQKIAEDVPYRIWKMGKAEAEKMYGDTMYDAFKVPDSVTELRLVNLERWNLNANINPVIKSTGLLKRLEITKTKFSEKKQQLEINFEVFPDKDPLLAETLDKLDNPPALENTVPDISKDPVIPDVANASSVSQEPTQAAGEKKEKKARPAPPPPPAALATAALLVRAAAAKVFGLRPGPCGGELQPVWVTEPGNAKITLSLENCSRPNMQKEELYDALIDAVEVSTNELVKGNHSIAVFEMDKDLAEKEYGDAMYDSKSAKTDKLHLAYIPDAALLDIPTNWSLCSHTGACGKIVFQKGADEARDPKKQKKAETLILYKKKQLSVRFSVDNGNAVGAALQAASGVAPSSAAVKQLDSGEVRVSVPGVDAAKAAASEVTADVRVMGGTPRYPYPKPNTPPKEPAAIYWSWFEQAFAKRLLDAVVAGGGIQEDIFQDPTPRGLANTCASTFKKPLSESEIAHLENAPVSADWLAKVLKGIEFPKVRASTAKDKDDTSRGNDAEAEDDGHVDPWSVGGKVDYKKLTEKFGSTEISPELLARIERLTVGRGRVKALHPWLRRGIFYSHRDLDRICQCVEDGIPFYLYTGRGPSSAAMHLGHLIPFMMTQWLQKAFDVPLVIQMTDDEKFLWKGEYTPGEGDNLMHYRYLTTENAKDIIACGFDKSKTFIFSDLEYVGHMYPNIVRIWKAITYNQARSAFGFSGENNIGQSAFPAVQAAPSFPSSFHVPLKGNHKLCCLIPCAIDQDPYFRMTRDIAHKIVPNDHPLKGKPSLIHSKFFPPLQGAAGKMSASDESSAVYLTDSDEVIESKIMRYAFSGGRVTAKEQKEKGADLDIDVSYQWLRFFLDDDQELEKIGADYGSGSGEFWNTGSVKKRLVQLLQDIVSKHVAARSKITDAEVAEWMAVRELQFS